MDQEIIFEVLLQCGINEELIMNRYHLALVIERSKQRYKGLRFEHVLIPLGICLATLLSVLAADFRDYLGFSAAVWESFALTVCILAALATGCLFILWIIKACRYKEKDSLEIVDDVIREMENDRKKLLEKESDKIPEVRADEKADIRSP